MDKFVIEVFPNSFLFMFFSSNVKGSLSCHGFQKFPHCSLLAFFGCRAPEGFGLLKSLSLSIALDFLSQITKASSGRAKLEFLFTKIGVG